MWVSLGLIKTVAAGTPVRLTSLQSDPTAPLKCQSLLVQRWPTNTGAVYIGQSASMDRTTGAGVLVVLDSTTPSAGAGYPQSPNALDASNYWLDSALDAEGAIVSVLIL